MLSSWIALLVVNKQVLTAFSTLIRTRLNQTIDQNTLHNITLYCTTSYLIDVDGNVWFIF